jgi:hypothetical protein
VSAIAGTPGKEFGRFMSIGLALYCRKKSRRALEKM